MTKMEEMIKRSKRLDDLIDYQSLSLFPNVRLPLKFKMPVMDKFDGTGFPKSHLKMYMRAMQPSKATKEMLAQMFQNTLTGATLKWFLNVEDTRTRNWKDICREFHNQYKYNILDVTRRDLETTKQEPKESFLAFITQWRAKATQMITRPSEEEQIQMVVKNLLYIFHKHLLSQYFPNFKALVIASTYVEDATNNGMLKNEEGSIFQKVVTHNTNEEAVNVVGPQILSTVNSRPRRKFNELHMPISQLFEKLKIEGYLGPLEPQPPPKPLLKGYKSHEFCKYHQEPSHQTNKCINL